MTIIEKRKEFSKENKKAANLLMRIESLLRIDLTVSGTRIKSKLCPYKEDSITLTISGSTGAGSVDLNPESLRKLGEILNNTAALLEADEKDWEVFENGVD